MIDPRIGSNRCSSEQPLTGGSRRSARREDSGRREPYECSTRRPPGSGLSEEPADLIAAECANTVIGRTADSVAINYQRIRCCGRMPRRGA
jgi:hypothetical protein